MEKANRRSNSGRDFSMQQQQQRAADNRQLCNPV